MGQSMTSSVIDVFLSSTVTSVYFLTAENWYKVPARIWAILFRGRPWSLRSQSFFIQICFKCDYNHYSAVAFGSARWTLWPKNVLRL